MNAGSLRHLLRVQSASEAQDYSGQPLQTWADVAERWASVEPLTAREQFNYSAYLPTATHRVKIRGLALLTPKHRFLLGSRQLNILGVTDKDGRGIEQVCICEEAVL